MKDMKDAKTWTLAELDEEISARKKEIEKLEAELKKLREVKWQKLCEEMKPTIADSNIDSISLNDVQQLLQNKFEADIEEKKQKKKSARSKKSVEKTSGDDDATQENSAEEKVADSDNATDSQEETADEGFENAPGDGNSPVDDLLNNPSAENATDNPPEENQSAAISEDATSQPKETTTEELKVIARCVGLPEDASLAEVRQEFELNKNIIPATMSENFKQTLERLERGETN